MGDDGVRVWNDRRAKTASMSYAEQQAFYDWVVGAYPEQAHFQRDLAVKELMRVAPEEVLEIGGWRGDLAALILSSPAGATVRRWTNVDISPRLATVQKCKDPRYRLVIPKGFIWEVGIEDVFDTVVATHLRKSVV